MLVELLLRHGAQEGGPAHAALQATEGAQRVSIMTAVCHEPCMAAGSGQEHTM